MTEMDNRILITGAGCLLPGCDTPAELWQRALEQRCATSAYNAAMIQSEVINRFGHISEQQAAAALEAVPFKLRRYAVASSQWGIKSARDALSAANVDLAGFDLERVGLFTAQGDYGYPSLPSFSTGVENLIGRGGELNLPDLTHEFLNVRGMDAFLSVKGLANNSLAIASLAFGIRGDCGAFVQDSSASIAALRAAMLSLKRGDSDLALVIFSGSYNEALTLVELYQGRQLAQGNSDNRFRPFDQTRDGGIAGEGAIALVLETAAHAQARSAPALAAIDGVGNSFRFERDPEAYSRCTQKLMQSIDLDLDAVDAIVARGLGSKESDAREIEQLEHLLANAPAIPVTCPTPITGVVPACPVDLLLALQMLLHQQVPAIANLTQPASALVPWVYRQPQTKAIARVLSLGRCYSGFHSAVSLSLPPLI